MVLFLFPLECSVAENVGTSITIGIQSTKTLTIRPFEPLERDMLSVYNAVYESLVVIDDNYLPQGCLAESWVHRRADAGSSLSYQPRNLSPGS